MKSSLEFIKKQFIGLDFAVTSPNQCAEQLSEFSLIDRNTGVSIHLICASSIYAAEKNSELYHVFRDAFLLLPDGRPISILGSFSNPRIKQVRGPQLFKDVIDLGRKYNLRHFLIGTTEEELIALSNKLTVLFPGCQIVGLYSPPFREMTKNEISDLLSSVNSADPNIVWVGMSTPKQDFFAARFSRETKHTFIAVGAAFDFASGKIKSSPKWITALSLEWLYRLINEPKRLWKRYLIGNFVFLMAVIKRQCLYRR